jgi:tetratricopeptide (TPR) repeat protein
MAQLRDDKLFRQPDESHLGECPLCCLPLSLDLRKSTMMSCCSQIICDGCRYANTLREKEEGLKHKCPFCREPAPDSQKECEKLAFERVEKNDPVALNCLGNKCDDEGDHEKAFEYYRKAAELGNLDGHYNLSLLYAEGEGVEKCKKKEIYHLEEAAIGGHTGARFNLGAHEYNAGRDERAIKHFIIAAKLGCDGALDKVKLIFVDGIVSKEDYAAALRGHQAAVDATKSTQRDAAEEFFK